MNPPEAILRVVAAFFVLFALPYIFVGLRFFGKKSITLALLSSAVFGVFVSIPIAFILLAFGNFNIPNFLLIYLPIAVLINVLIYKKYGHEGIVPGPLSLKIRMRSDTFLLSASLLILSLTIGFYLRFYDPLTHISYPYADPYAHLAMTRHIILNDFFGPVLPSYPRAFHIILALIQGSSGLDLYTVLRYSGAFFSLLSILSLYALVSVLKNRFAGSVAALIYSALPLGRAGELAMARYSQTMPENLALFLIPLLLLFAVEVVRTFRHRRANDEGAEGRKAPLILFVLTAAVVALVHGQSMFLATYMLVIILLFALLLFKESREVKAFAPIVGLFFLGMFIVYLYYRTINSLYEIPFVEGGASTPTATGTLWRDFFHMAYFNPTPEFILMVAVSSVSTLYGLLKKHIFTAFLGASTLLFGIMSATDLFVIFASEGRSIAYYLVLQAALIGIIVNALRDRTALREARDFLTRVGVSKITRHFTDRSVYLLLYGVIAGGILGYLAFSILEGYIGFASRLALSAVLAVLVFFKVSYFTNRWFKAAVHADFDKEERKVFTVLVALAVVVICLVPPPAPPNIGHIGYEENMTVSLRIREEFDLSEVAVYSQRISVFINREYAVLEPEALHYELDALLREENGTGGAATFQLNLERKHTFIFVEKAPHGWRASRPKEIATNYTDIDLMGDVRAWMEWYRSNGNATLYEETESLAVYLVSTG